MELGIILPSVAAFGVLLAFFGLAQIMRPEIDVSARLGWQDVDNPSIGGEESSSALTKRVDRAVADRDFAARIAHDLAQADLKLTVSEYLMLRLLAVVGLFAIIAIIARNPIIGVLGGVLGFYMPRIYVSSLKARRLKLFNSQLPDTLSLMVNSLRSGYGLLQSMEMVSKEAPKPTNEEFGRVVREVALGLSPEDALSNLVRRINSDDLDLVATAINVQHEVGGNMAQILETIAATIRDRVKLKGDIGVLTAQQRLSGYVVTIMPVGLAFLMFLINPKYMSGLFSMEQVICMPMVGLPICSGVMVIIGFFVIQKIADIDV
jgi:tight adherence protein B